LSKETQKYREHIKTFSPRRNKIHEVIFEAETPLGKWFDIALMFLIILSVLVVAIETLPGLSDSTKHILHVIEWVLTIFFTIEYILRLYCVYRPMKYATSFYGVVDLLSIIPTYLILFLPIHTQSLMMVRALRLLRVFRIFKLAAYTRQGNFLVKAIKDSIPKIIFFLFFILLMVCIFGSIMYLIEGEKNKAFNSIPTSIYWAIVTITTVGYGDISPQTGLGQFISSLMMIIGYAIIAVPTGIVTSEMVSGRKDPEDVQEILAESCMFCMKEGHEADAIHCKYCGEMLNPNHQNIQEKLKEEN